MTDRSVSPNIAEVRGALSCWRQGTWSRAYAMEQFEKLLQGFVDRNAHETTLRPGELEQLRRIDRAARALVDAPSGIQKGRAMTALEEALFDARP